MKYNTTPVPRENPYLRGKTGKAVKVSLQYLPMEDIEALEPEQFARDELLALSRIDAGLYDAAYEIHLAQAMKARVARETAAARLRQGLLWDNDRAELVWNEPLPSDLPNLPIPPALYDALMDSASRYVEAYALAVIANNEESVLQEISLNENTLLDMIEQVWANGWLHNITKMLPTGSRPQEWPVEVLRVLGDYTAYDNYFVADKSLAPENAIFLATITNIYLYLLPGHPLSALRQEFRIIPQATLRVIDTDEFRLRCATMLYVGAPVNPKQLRERVKRALDLAATREREDAAEIAALAETNPDLARVLAARRAAPDIVRFADGWRVTEIVDADALRREGLLMRNCLARHVTAVLSGYERVFALRNANDESVLSITLTPDGKSLTEVKGPYNRDVGSVPKTAQKERAYLAEFLRVMGAE